MLYLAHWGGARFSEWLKDWAGEVLQNWVVEVLQNWATTSQAKYGSNKYEAETKSHEAHQGLTQSPQTYLELKLSMRINYTHAPRKSSGPHKCKPTNMETRHESPHTPKASQLRTLGTDFPPTVLMLMKIRYKHTKSNQVTWSQNS